MKRFAAIIVAICMVCCPIPSMASAASAEEQGAADALNSLGLFLGYGDDAEGNPNYGLNDKLTREQGIILLLRMLGKEEEAKKSTYANPFTDVSKGYEPYIAYAYHNGLTKGTGATTFGGKSEMSETMFLTFCLRTLGYSDSGASADFQWDKAATLATELGIIPEVSGSSVNAEAGETPISGVSTLFSRGNTVDIFWNVLNTPMKGETKTLSDKLISEGVYTKEDFKKAEETKVTSTEETKKEEPAQAVGGGGGGGGAAPCSHKTLLSEITTQPTCTIKGVRTYTCKDCKKVIKTEAVDMLPHTYEYKSNSTQHWQECSACHTKTTAANHGFDANHKCTICGYGCTHSFSEKVTAPTCTEQGYTTHTCSICKYSYVADYVSKLGHNYSGVETKAPKCTETGVMTYTCSRCKDSYTSTISALGHQAQAGYQHDAKSHWQVCSRCKANISTAAHTYTTKVTAPTCTAKGYTTHTCSVCGYSYTDGEKAALGHSWDSGTVTKAATCTATGVMTYHCTHSGCNETKTETISELGHHYVGGVCTRCGSAQNMELPEISVD